MFLSTGVPKNSSGRGRILWLIGNNLIEIQEVIKNLCTLCTLCTSVVVYETEKEVERDGDGRRKKDQLQMFDQVSIDFINSILAWTIFADFGNFNIY